jgi:hypothetical protein
MDLAASSHHNTKHLMPHTNTTHIQTNITNNEMDLQEKCRSLGYGPPLQLSVTGKIIAVTLYTLIALMAVGGNSIVVFIIAYFKRLRTPTNMLIMNLAVADLLMAALCVPFTYWSDLILLYWPFGEVTINAIT